MDRSKDWSAIIEMQRAGRFTEAQALLEREGVALSEAERLECLGNQFFSARKLQDAIDHYERAITLEPEHTIARYQYLVGVQEAKSKNYKEAFHRFVAAIEAEPTFVDSYVELGAMLLGIGDAKGALRCFEDALRNEPNELGHYYNCVAACMELAKGGQEI